ncbi:MAG: DUF2490 domain-containing protein [Candidatus Omnitrophica bacterium]|nr:DUF2490 domain-containing protein [Candidatus Omnitrophota bacterium]MCM8794151.1 DUF2490 domain-containing protein [Candidatus Omnitrophota bacterium]
MKKKIIFYILGLIILENHTYADWEWWNETEFNWKLNKQTEWGFVVEQKFKNDMHDLYLYNFQSGITFALNDYWDFGLSYKYEKEREYEHKKWQPWLDEHRIQIDPVLKWECWGLKISDRNRFEYRILEARKDRWRYCNRIKIKKEIIRTEPYLANEIFYDFYKDTLNKNRFELGIGKKWAYLLETEIYYMLESSKNGNDWHHSTNVLGTVLKIKF